MRRLLKRIVAGMAAVGLFATLLTGCGGTDTPDPPIISPDQDVGEITYTAPEDENIEEDVTSEGSYFVNNEILLTAVEGVTKAEITALVRPYNGTIVGYIELTNDCQVRFNQVYTIDELQNIVDELKLNEKVEDASIHQLDETVSNAIPNDSEWADEEWSTEFPEGKNWGVEAIDAMGAWDYRSQMQDVRVGIIDTMFDTNHEDLNFAQVWNNPDNINSWGEGKKDERSHGTHVAGTIAAKYDNGIGVAGVAPTAKLYAYSIHGTPTDDTVTSSVGLSGSMEWKYALAKLITANCRVINVSMGLAHPRAIASTKQAENYGPYLSKLLMRGYDFLIVQAAGNDSIDATLNGIFCGITDEEVSKHIIVVGAIGTSGSSREGFLNLFGERVFKGYYFSDYSNYGSRVDVVAPGDIIYSTVPGNKYDNWISKVLIWSWSGTSMAAPHVTGIAANCFAVNPSLSAKQVKEIIMDTCDQDHPITDSYKSHSYADESDRAYYLVNAKAAVEQALNSSGTTTVNPANAIVLGRVCHPSEDGQRLIPFDTGARVTVYRVSSSDDNVSGYAASTNVDHDGNFELVLAAGTYHIGIFADNYQPFAYANVTVTDNEIKYLDPAVLVHKTEGSASAELSGYAINALTGSNISGVTVKLRTGWDRKTGALAKVYGTDTDAVTTTNSYGYYSLEMEEGTYTAEFSKEGFVTGYTNVVCFEGNSTSQDGSMTPVLNENEYRIVLTWGETPRDLDSHLSGPRNEDGDRFHVYYSNKSATASTEDGNVTVARLDHDDTSSYGPETITLIKLSNDSVYHYAVHDFTNRTSSESKALSMSGAKIVVYHGNGVIATFNVPINKVGTVWNVFDIQGNQLIPVNTMESISRPDSVTMQDDTSSYASYTMLAELDEVDESEEKEETFEDDPIDEAYLEELAELDVPVEEPIELD